MSFCPLRNEAVMKERERKGEGGVSGGEREGERGEERKGERGREIEKEVKREWGYRRWRGRERRRERMG